MAKQQNKKMAIESWRTGMPLIYFSPREADFLSNLYAALAGLVYRDLHTQKVGLSREALPVNPFTAIRDHPLANGQTSPRAGTAGQQRRQS